MKVRDGQLLLWCKSECCKDQANIATVKYKVQVSVSVQSPVSKPICRSPKVSGRASLPPHLVPREQRSGQLTTLIPVVFIGDLIHTTILTLVVDTNLSSGLIFSCVSKILCTIIGLTCDPLATAVIVLPTCAFTLVLMALGPVHLPLSSHCHSMI